MHTCRFKIDVNPYSETLTFSLLRAVDRTYWSKKTIWSRVASFKTQDEARARYEMIKELPEYLR